MLLDGEIVAIDQNGRISFTLLQHHRSHAQALLFYAFDYPLPRRSMNSSGSMTIWVVPSLYEVLSCGTDLAGGPALEG